MSQQPSDLQKIVRLFTHREVPWRLRIAACFLRGLATDPRKALRYGRGITLDMKTVYRFNLHIHGERFLRDLLSEAERLGMRPFLLYGSLLGCIREGGPLDHDYDLDLGILEADYPKKNALIAAMLSRGYRLRFDRPYKFSFELKDRLLHLDIDLLYAYDGRLVSSMASERTGAMTAHSFPSHAFTTLARRRFGGIAELWVPGDAEAVLEAAYGDWRTPVKQYNFETDLRSRMTADQLKGIEAGPLPWNPYRP